VHLLALAYCFCLAALAMLARLMALPPHRFP
jgi:hypothetical protein